MRISIWIKAAAFVFSIFATTTALAEVGPVIAGPQASAAEIRAAHGTTTSQIRRVIFDKSGGYEAASNVRVDLGSDYIHFLVGDSDTILDFKLRRRIFIDATGQTFSNSSLYADIAFRVNEAANRQMLSKVLSEAGVKADATPMSPTDVEMQLGLSLPGSPSPQLVTKTDSDGTVHFSNNSKEIATVHFGNTRLSGSEEGALAHFLHYGTLLHPQVIDTIVRDGRIPDGLSYPEYKGYEYKLITLTLKSVDILTTDYPLPASYANDPMPGVKGKRAILKEVFPIMLDAVARRASGGPRSTADYRDAIETAFQKGKNLQAAVLIFELNLHHGQGALACPSNPPSPCHSLPGVMRAASSDQQVQLLVKALSYQGPNAADGVPYLRKIDRSGISNPYVIDIFLANDLNGSEEAVALFASGIRGNPYIAGFYKDFGDYWFRGYDMWDAWLLYDLARSLPDARDTPMLDAVDSLEHRLATDFPQFF